MTRAGRAERRWTARFVALAILSLLIQLAVPPGFMVAAGTGGPAVVICTGHGPMMSTVDPHGASQKTPTGKAAPLCPFAGHGGVPTVAAAPGLACAAYPWLADAPTARPSVDPGRGLAAPPPPAQAPPALST